MILYYLASFYQLLLGLIYKLKSNDSRKVIFVVDDFLMNSCEEIQNVVNTGLVDELYSLPFIPVKDNTLDWVVKEAEKQIKKLPYELESFDEIYVGATHSWFGIYLAKRNICFNMFEESCGILSKIFKLRENVAKTSVLQDEYAGELGLYDGSTETIKSIICSSTNNKDILCNEKIILFDLYKEILTISDENMEKVLSVFAKNTLIPAKENSVLLLTQHFANLGILEWNEQQEVYKIMLDYFCQSDAEIYIKAHPADIMNYEEVLLNCHVVKERVPSELLPLILKPLPKSIMTLSSTAIDEIGPLFERSISFDFWYEQWFPVTHNYYCALAQIENYIEKGYKLYTYGVNRKLINNLNTFSLYRNEEIIHMENVSEIKMVQNKAIILIDDFAEIEVDADTILQNAYNKVIFIYLNSTFKYKLLDKALIEKMSDFQPVYVWIDDGVREFVNGKYYVFSKGEQLEMIEIKKKLKYENSVVYTELFEDDKLKVKILEGMLRATEERLLFYLDKELPV